MNPTRTLTCLLFAAALVGADEFDDRFQAAAKQVYESEEGTRKSGLDDVHLAARLAVRRG